jgi:hypothetical protein
MKGRSSWKALRQADPIVAGSQNASVKGRIDSRIQCRQHDHENHLARGASIDSLLDSCDDLQILHSRLASNCLEDADGGQVAGEQELVRIGSRDQKM